MARMRVTVASAVLLPLLLASCGAPIRPAPPPAAPTGSPAGSAQPSPGIPAPPSATATPEPPYVPPPRQFRLGPATTALVAQAHAQANGGDYGLAVATLERAQRIEPDNPLLWIELGRVQLNQNNAAQADAMGRKALALATGDVAAQAAAWRLIADSLRARGRNPEAAQADRQADTLAPR
jgi:Tfp pilus assembly protein PilF